VTDFLRRLRDRKLAQWALAYLAGAWVALQGTAILADQFLWPGWVQRSVTVLLAVGLLLVLVLAWYHGEQGRQRASGPELLMVAALLVVAGAGILLVRGSEPDGPDASDAASAGPGPADLASGAGPSLSGPAASAAGHRLDPRKVAVLPFRALGSDEEGRAFALGVHDDILTRLSRVRDLRVISRTSVMEYENSPDNIREIAAELGAGAIVEGGVQRAGGQVRLNVQLIDARSDTHLWAETYDREWSLANLFAIQSEIAERVASALQATLSAEERARIESRPTDDVEAYELYQRARRHLVEQEVETPARLATEALVLATRRDPTFAEAFALLGYAHAGLHWFHFDRSPERLRAAKAAIDSALALDPELPEAHVAMGWYWYWGHLDYERALEEFGIAERSIPNDAELLLGIGSVKRRQGRTEEALEYFRRAEEMAPRDATPVRTVGETLRLLDRYEEAEARFRRHLRLRPESPSAYVRLTVLYQVRGDLAAARAILERARELGVSDPVLTGLTFDLRRLERDHDGALEVLRSVAGGAIRDGQFRYVPVELAAAEIHVEMGESARAEELFGAAVARLERELEARPDDERLHGALGLALAGLGRAGPAVELLDDSSRCRAT